MLLLVHALIGALVYENTERQALTKAEADVFDPLVDSGAFEYYETFESPDHPWLSDEETAVYADRAPAVEDVATDQGQEFVSSRFQTMIGEVERQARCIDAYFDAVDGDYSDLWLESDHDLIRYSMWTVRKRQRWPVKLYGQDRQGICNRERLEDVIQGTPSGVACYAVTSEARW